MTGRQKQKAAKLWSLAMVVHGSGQEEDTEAENEIRNIAGEVANNKLHQMGYEARNLLTMKNCMDAVSR